MKPLSQMSHYEVLEVSPDAEANEVDRAYRIAAAAYEDDSLATYSVYEESEVAAIRERDRTRVPRPGRQRGPVGIRCFARQRPRGPGERERGDRARFRGSGGGTRGQRWRPRSRSSRTSRIPTRGSFDGARLRRTRLSRGIDLDKISSVTKINTGHLLSIEEERYGDLPADVYVRGFVIAYARCVGLDPERVSVSYMERLREGRQPAPAKVTRNR